MRLSVLVCWATLTGLALARPITFSIRSQPSGAEVYRYSYGRAPGESAASLVGASDTPLLFELPEEQSNLTLEVRHPDCHPLRFQVDIRQLLSSNSSAWPLAGQPPLQLQYLSSAHRWKAALRGWALPLGGGALLLLFGVSFALVKLSQARRQMEVARAAQQKADTINQLVVPREEDDPLLGALLDGYRLVELVGEGGMARVYRAVADEELESGHEGAAQRHWVAIKILNVGLSGDDEALRRIERERQAYEALRHPHLVQLFGAGRNGPHIYIVMEFVKGQTLRQHIPPAGVGLRQALAWMTPVIQAIHHAHSKGVVHRDLKPENIMLSEKGEIKVMDLGLARGGDLAQVTATGALLGTPAYMAPEQVQGEVHTASDQYALGIMLYELLTGSVPYHDDNLINLALQHVTKPVPRLVDKRPKLVKTSAVLERMLAKDPAQRYPDLQSALKALGLAESVDGS